MCFGQFQQSFSESEVKEDDNETEHNSTATPARTEIKKKRKKRKKKGKPSASNHRSSEDNADVCVQHVNLYIANLSLLLIGFKLISD